jgi:hypothetical protein
MSRLLHAAIRTAQWTFAAMAVAGCVQIAVWALDRRPPFHLVSVQPALAIPGQSVVLTMVVRRNVERECSVTWSRWVFDGRNVRIDLEGQQQMGAAGISDIEVRNAGRLTISVPIPSSAFPGGAELVYDLDYVCNPLQRWWPINVVARVPFEIANRDKIG